ncbi:conserved hypothetical protein [Coccidioides posadasii str. Silveira]|uniref:Uncharacterized protein n=1 Tax=Coccidioides posadasii (strain RMSCC 757 / Silveira) TaxID=443226 RepID=E9DIC4_COCPS|nr:conserved hypothetical protein [Coccidioides posadasii str. Silveira]
MRATAPRFRAAMDRSRITPSRDDLSHSPDSFWPVMRRAWIDVGFAFLGSTDIILIRPEHKRRHTDQKVRLGGILPWTCRLCNHVISSHAVLRLHM